MSNNAPNITSAEVTSVNEDTDYSYTFTATDVDSGDTVTLAAPTKPSWLSFNPGTGVLSGTPTNRNVGDHSIALSATDVMGAVTTQNFIITVSNINDAPTVNVANSSVYEDDGTGALIATLTSADEDGETVSFTLSNVDDFWAVNISENKVYLKQHYYHDHEGNPLKITVLANDVPFIIRIISLP